MSNLITIHRYDEGQVGKITPSVVEKRLQLIRSRALKTQTHDNTSQSSKPSPSQKRKLKHDTLDIQSENQKKHQDSISTQPESEKCLKKRKHDTSHIQPQIRKSKKITKHDTTNTQPENHITSQAQHQRKLSKISKKQVSINQTRNNQNLQHSSHEQLIQPVDPIVENDNVDGSKDDTINQANNDDHPEKDQAQNSQYIILGRKASDKTTQVSVPENFPEWIAKPNYINSQNKVEIEEVSQLQKFMIKKLKNQGISHLFPVQSEIIPTILKDYQHFGLYTPLPVHDICVSAPTGSGKTLIYVLPIIQILMRRSIMLLRALILVPTADLAYQVKKVFEQFNEGSGLKISTAIGQRNFKAEQEELVDSLGGRSNIDILIATPGRLIDHINMTEHFTLQHLRFLVLDEADKLLTSSYHQLVAVALRSCYKSEMNQINTSNSKFILHTTLRDPPLPSIVSKCHSNKFPLQKLLFSATLTYDPEKLAPLELFSPILYQMSAQALNLTTGDGEYYATPVELAEYYIICEPSEKPLMIIHFLLALKHLRILCFTNSKESTKRLSLLLSIYGDIRVAALSSEVLRKDRKRIIKQFSAGEIDILICSDTVARGIDIEKVEYIINYDVPNHINTYIHRVGRTARAGQSGIAYTLLHKQEAKFFKTMLGRKRANVKKLKINSSEFDNYIDRYKLSLQKLEATITEADNNKKRKLGPFRKDITERNKDTEL